VNQDVDKSKDRAATRPMQKGLVSNTQDERTKEGESCQEEALTQLRLALLETGISPEEVEDILQALPVSEQTKNAIRRELQRLQEPALTFRVIESELEEFEPGDILVISRRTGCRPGEPCLVEQDGRLIVRKLTAEDEAEQIFGVVVEVRRPKAGGYSYD
jgi:DNA-binding transcriptional MerR regulator